MKIRIKSNNLDNLMEVISYLKKGKFLQSTNYTKTIRKILSASERTIFYIDTGRLPINRARNYLKKIFVMEIK